MEIEAAEEKTGKEDALPGTHYSNREKIVSKVSKHIGNRRKGGTFEE